MIKLYAWEIPFKRQVMDIRDEELKVLRASAYLNAGSSFTWTCAPFMVRRCVYVCAGVRLSVCLSVSVSGQLLN